MGLGEERPLAFLRMSFGALMMVYSAGKCSEDHLINRELGLSFHSFDKRVPPWLYSVFVANFPWVTRQELYWKFHAPLMLLCAAGITLGFGGFSRACSLLFFLLKVVLTLQTQHTFNNHEYLYALVALALVIVPGHDVRHSFFGKIVIEALGSKESTTAVGPGYALFMLLSGVTYMMLQNAVYGIAGVVAPLGMGLLVWPSIVLLMGEAGSPRAGGPGDVEEASPHTYLMRLLFSFVYFFAGVAKTGRDWLSGRTPRELMRLWTGPTAPLILGRLGVSDSGGGGGYKDLFFTCVVWGGLLLDLSAMVGLNLSLIDRRGTSKALFVLLLGAFHTANHFLFVLETFPWVMMSAFAVHFDSSWMDGFARGVARIIRWVPRAETRSASPWHVVATALRPLLWLGSLLLACLLVGAPLPCAVHSFREDGSLTWGSQCQYWSWRMMSRSTRVLPVGLLMRSREGGRDREWSQSVGLRGVWQEAGAYEDRLLSLVHSYKGLRTARGPPTNGTGTATLDYSSEQSEKFADVWVEVNGPPFQRYVHPKVDLAKQRIEPPPGGIRAAVARYVDELWRGPQPLASWVMPRLLSLRSAEWQRLFEAYEERVAGGREGKGTGQCTAAEGEQEGEEREGEGEGEGEGAEVVFLADTRGTRPVQISSLFGQEAGPSCDGLRTAEVQVLGGRAQVLNLEGPAEVAAGACMRLRGELVLRAVGEEPVVLAVVLTRGHQHCPRLYKKLRLSSAPEGAPMPAPAMLLLALGPNATGSYPATFRHCMDLRSLH